ncbi:MAG: SpaA isopeptide-forming pilin-related protein, partial [Thermomicrobiales bacterium]
RSARRPLSNLLHRPDSARRKKRAATALTGGGRNLHLVAAIALMLGLLLQATQYSNALSAPFEESFEQLTSQSDGDVASAPQVVVAIGDFQSQLGCSDYDINCAATQLTDQGGYWTGSFPIPAGDYNYQIGTVGADGNVYAFGQGGLNGDTDGLSISEGQAGAYFSFNSSSYEVDAQALDAIAVLNTDLGSFFLDNNLSTIIFAQGSGSVGFQLTLNGEPVSDPQSVDLQAGPNRISVNSDGSLNDVESLGYATLTVTRAADGQAAAGSCFQVLDGGSVIAQGCDLDDGNADGNTTIFFAGGADSGNYTLREVTAPDGLDPAEDQDVQIENGDNSVQVDSGGSGRSLEEGEDATDDGSEDEQDSTDDSADATDDGSEDEQDATDDGTVEEEPTNEVEENIPSDLIVSLVDGDGNGIGGACFELVNQDGESAESCDRAENGDTNPDNGNTGFFGVPSGTYTLRLSDAPDGVESADEQEVEVVGGEATNVQVVASATPQEPTEEPEPTDEPTDEAQPTDEPTVEPTEEPAPTEEVAPTEETTDPDGGSADGPPGDLIVSLVDGDDNPIGGACFQLVNPDDSVAAESCDSAETGDTNPDNGNTGFFGVASGEYTLRQSEAPEGSEAIEDTTVTVKAGTSLNESVVAESAAEPTAEPTDEPTAEPTDEPTAEPELGSILITVLDEEGNTIEEGRTCVFIEELGQELCDNGQIDTDPDNGSILVENLPLGNYSITTTDAPEGFDVAAESDQVEVVSEDEPAIAELTFAPEGPLTGSVTINVIDDASEEPVAAGCFDITNESGTFNFCDDDADGTIAIPDVTFGTQTITQTSAAEGYAIAADSQSVDLTDEEAEVSLTFRNTVATGSILVSLTEDEAPLAVEGSCVTIDDLDLVICDNGDGDTDPAVGSILVENVPFGTYSVTVSTAPDGYLLPETAGTADVNSADEPALASIPLEIEPTAIGNIAIVATDDADAPLAGACFTLANAETTYGPLCDDDADGTTNFTEIPVGTWTLTETTAPTGYTAVAPIDIEIAEGDNEAIRIAHVLTPITVSVSTSDGQGGAPDGACYAIDGGEPVCDIDGDGIVNFENVVPGVHVFTQTTPPTGYQEVDAQEVDIIPGEVESVVFVNDQTLNGALVVTVLDPEANPVSGANVTIAEGNAITDNAANDADPVAGSIRFDDLEAGDYSVTVSGVPVDYLAPEATSVTVVSGEVVTLEISLTGAPDQTGSVEVQLQDPEGNPAAEGCVILSNSALGQQLGPFCDNGEGDNDTDSGTVLLEEVPVGIWNVSVPSEDTEGQAVTAADATSSRTIQVQANVVIIVIIIVIGPPTEGALQITTRDSETNASIAGACYELASGATTIDVCDNDDTDNNGTPGLIRVSDLEPGTYSITLTNKIPGYTQEAVPTADVEAGTLTYITVELVPSEELGTVIVNKVDDAGESLSDSCFALRQNNVIIFEQCDASDAAANDGQLVFEDVPAGIYRLIETQAPSSDYMISENLQITVVAGESAEYTRSNSLKPADLIVRKVDAADGATLLAGACFSLQNSDGDTVYGSYCDSADRTNDGRTRFNDVPVGEYTLVEDAAPYGYARAANVQITIQPGGATQIVNVENELLPPPEETGSLIINKENANNTILKGACFRLYDGAYPLTNTVCDNTDGSNDGIIRFNDIPVGTFELRETVTPSESYQAAEPQDVEINEDETTEITVVNTLKNGRIRIEKTNTDGSPLQNACFDLLEDDAEAQCTNANGITIFENLEPGAYTLRETQAPYGYLAIKDKAGITVYAAKTTTVDVVNQRTPPDPDTGSVQVLKFYCPAGEAGERTVFLGGAAGNAELAKTANCEVGNAGFNLDQDDGNGGPGDFTVGTDGRYQVSVPAGTYSLAETDPDLE